MPAHHTRRRARHVREDAVEGHAVPPVARAGAIGDPDLGAQAEALEVAHHALAAPRVGIERAFATTLGLSLEELSHEWASEVRKTYLPQIAEYRQPNAFAKKLTAHHRLEDPWYLAPAISADGRRMAFLSQRDGFSFDLYLADATTGEIERKLIETAGNAGFESLRYMSSGAAFSPDGRYIAFAAQSGGADALYLYDLERRGVSKKLRFDLNGIANPSWAPDSRRIVFTGLDGGVSDLFITDLDGNSRRLTDDAFAAAGSALELVPGIEVSTSHDGLDLHLLGYFIDPEHAPLRQRLAGFRDERVARARRIVTRLKELGMELDGDAILAQAGPGVVGRPHVAAALLRDGHVESLDDAFRRFLGVRGEAYVPRPAFHR